MGVYEFPVVHYLSGTVDGSAAPATAPASPAATLPPPASGGNCPSRLFASMQYASFVGPKSGASGFLPWALTPIVRTGFFWWVYLTSAHLAQSAQLFGGIALYLIPPGPLPTAANLIGGVVDSFFSNAALNNGPLVSGIRISPFPPSGATANSSQNVSSSQLALESPLVGMSGPFIVPNGWCLMALGEQSVNGGVGETLNLRVAYLELENGSDVPTLS